MRATLFLFPFLATGCIGPCALERDCRVTQEVHQHTPEVDPPIWLDDSTTTYLYDEEGRLVESSLVRTVQGGREVTDTNTYGYDEDGHLSTERYQPTGAGAKRYEYETDERGNVIVKLTYLGSSAEPWKEEKTVWDEHDRMTSVSITVGETTRSTTYSYDDQGRLELEELRSSEHGSAWRACTQHVHDDLAEPDPNADPLDYTKISCSPLTVVHHLGIGERDLVTFTDRSADYALDEVRWFERDRHGNPTQEYVARSHGAAPTRRIVREWECD